MKIDYQQSLQTHLADYARNSLRVLGGGTYRGKIYPHILPKSLQELNLLETSRTALRLYLRANPSIKLHMYFHHLNSSQAFAFNLFFPFFSAGAGPARALSSTLGVDQEVTSNWEFEHIADANEGTNADIMWHTTHARVYCEVKLSERGFGTAVNDLEHCRKLEAIYEPRLRKIVAPDLLDEATFFRNYQLLRNVSLLAANDTDRLVILHPHANRSLHKPLQKVLDGVAPAFRSRITVAYVEECLASLNSNTGLPIELRSYASQLSEKYVI
jgi:hypothetical protein